MQKKKSKRNKKGTKEGNDNQYEWWRKREKSMKARRKGMKEDRTVDEELKDITTERIRQKETEKQVRIREWMRERKQI